MELRQQGFVGAKPEEVVDQWFQTVCRNVAMQTWEQYDADPENRAPRVTKRDIGDGRSEIG